MANDDPFEKSTPFAWRIAFPLKLSAPEGSLPAGERCSKQNEISTYTILPKFEKGVPHVACGDRRGISSMFGLPPPKPALLGPPPDGNCNGIPPAISFTFSLGAARRAARPPIEPGGLPGAEGADWAERSMGCIGLSASAIFCRALAASSTPGC